MNGDFRGNNTKSACPCEVSNDLWLERLVIRTFTSQIHPHALLEPPLHHLYSLQRSQRLPLLTMYLHLKYSNNSIVSGMRKVRDQRSEGGRGREGRISDGNTANTHHFSNRFFSTYSGNRLTTSHHCLRYIHDLPTLHRKDDMKNINRRHNIQHFQIAPMPKVRYRSSNSRAPFLKDPHGCQSPTIESKALRRSRLKSRSIQFSFVRCTPASQLARVYISHPSSYMTRFLPLKQRATPSPPPLLPSALTISSIKTQKMANGPACLIK